MADVMVTGRMPSQKKHAGNSILKDAGLNASQAINLMYSKLIEERSTDFLKEPDTASSGGAANAAKWKAAAAFIDSLASPTPVKSRFDAMTDSEIKMDRLRAKKLV